jgi:hypothetical protein
MAVETWSAPPIERGHDQPPAAQQPVTQQSVAQQPAAQGGNGTQPDAYASRRETCWLCGQVNVTYQLVPDGGDGCDDVRWYCLDTHACTERWVVARKPGR